MSCLFALPLKISADEKNRFHSEVKWIEVRKAADDVMESFLDFLSNYEWSLCDVSRNSPAQVRFRWV